MGQQYVIEGDIWENTSATDVVDSASRDGAGQTIPAGAVCQWDGYEWDIISAPAKSSTTAPTNPAKGQFWRDSNTTPNKLKIWNGSSWDETATFVTEGSHIGVANGATRNVNRGAFVSGTAYEVGDIVTSGGASYSCVTAATYSTAPPTTGWSLLAEKGAAGQGKVKGICFLRSSSVPGTPTGGSFASPTATGWSDGVPSGTAQLYMSSRLFTSDELNQDPAWSTPVAISKDGLIGQGVAVQFSSDNVNWHSTAVIGDLYMRTGTSSDGVSYTYSGSVLIKGEQGLQGNPGLSGSPAVAATLSNDSQSFPCDNNGNVLSWSGNSSTMTVYVGATDDSVNWSYITTTSNCTITGTNTNTVAVQSLSADAGYVDITASRSGYSSVTKRFTLSKAKAGTAGVDATIYMIESSVGAINSDSAGTTFTPSSITFYAYSKTGSANKAAYTCRMAVFGSNDGGTTWSTVSAATDGLTSRSATPSSSYSLYKGVMYVNGTSTELDYQTVPVVKNGSTGGTGPSGKTAVRVYLKNSNAATPPTGPSGNISATGSANDTWYTNTQTLIAGQVQWQCDGLYDPTTTPTSTTWGLPYLSYFKVDTLEAFTAITGELKTATSGKRCVINEKVAGVGSNEFRAYTSTGLLLSLGDQQVGTDLTAINLDLAYASLANNYTGIRITQPYSTFTSSLFTATKYRSDSPLNYQYQVALCDQYAAGSFRKYHNTSATFTCYLAGNAYAAFFSDGTNSVKLADYNSPGYAINATGNVNVSGTITATGNVTAYDTSDKRLKKNIKPLKNPIEKIKQIGGYSFTWKKSYYKKQHKELFKEHDVGVLAQEIEMILPEAVHHKKDGTLGVDYKKIIPLLIECIKIQDERITRLEGGVK